MPMTYVVPDLIQRAAREALQVHHDQQWKLDEVYGVSVADALVSGHVTLDVVQKMDRFFSANEKPFLDEQRNLRDLKTSSTIRSWELHGGVHGKVWSSSTVKKAADEGLIEADPILGLFKLTPDEVYGQFSLGAWRYEYGLDPRKAARFVEEYMRATGMPLDLSRAFGDSSRAVGNAIYRRFNAPNPFQDLFRSMMVDDYGYKEAVREDLEYARTIIPAEDRLLTESLSKQTFTTMSAMQAAKLVWPAFFAHIILAVEAPELLAPVNDAKYTPPAPGSPPKVYTQYSDAVNTYVSYFHPEGSRSVDPSGDEKAAGLAFEMYNVLWKAYYKKPLYMNAVKPVLMKARYWMKVNSLSGPIFSVIFADWLKGNWEGIYERIPEDSDVKVPFSNLAKLNPLPKSGVTLQQQPYATDTLTKDTAKTHFDSAEPGEPKPDTVQAVSLSKTKSGMFALTKGTPMGIGSVMHLEDMEGKWLVKGAFGDPQNLDPVTTAIVFMEFTSSVIGADKITQTDHDLLQSLKSGKSLVLQGHHSLPGTMYAEPDVPPAVYTSEPPATIDAAVWDVIKDDFEGSWTDFTEMKLSDTITSDTMEEVYDVELKAGEILIDKAGNQFTFLKAFMTPGGPIIVVKSPDNEIVWYEDADMAEVVSKGTVKFASMSGIPTPEPVWVDTPKEPPKPELNVGMKSSEVYVPKYHVGSIIKYHGHHTRIVGVIGDRYVLQDLHTYLGNSGIPFKVYDAPAKKVDESVYGVEGSPVDTRELVSLEWVTVSDGVDVDGPLTLDLGDSLEFMDSVVFYGGTYAEKLGAPVSHHLVWFPAYFGIDGALVGYDGLKFVNSKLINIAETSYAPTAPVPEPGAEDAMDEPDPEQGSVEMCGTEGAINYMLHNGYKPAVKSESKDFVIGLGDKQEYPKKKGMRVVIGYAFKNNSPIYITMTENGNISWKTTVNGNIDYQPFIESVQSVVASLKPKPEDEKKAAESKFPKLNYPLSKEAKAVAASKGLIYQTSPKDAAYSVGTKVVDKQTGNVFKLIGWVIPQIAQDEGALEIRDAVLKPPGSINIAIVPKKVLAVKYEIVYQNKSQFNTKTKEIIFGKSKSDATFMLVTTGNMSIPSGLPTGWDMPGPVKQPPMQFLPSDGKHVSAGIIAVVPAGSTVNDGNTLSEMSLMQVVCTYPMNEYGGYKLTYPKGTVEKGESIECAAVREVWEETGLSVKPVAYLGDFKGNNSVTRFFIGFITGGDPQDAGKETDAVSLKALGPGTWDAQPWVSELHERDQQVTEAAYNWVVKNGVPEEYVPEQAAAHTAITGPQDIEGQTGPQVYDPSFTYATPKMGEKQQSTTIDYNVDEWTADQCEQIADGAYMEVKYAQWWFRKQSDFFKKGFPPVGGQSFPAVGVKVKYKDLPYSYEVKAYSHFSDDDSHTVFLIGMTMGTGNKSGFRVPVETNQPELQSFVAKPEDFMPEDASVEKKTKTLTGSTQKVDVYAALAYNTPFPVTQEMIDALKGQVSVSKNPNPDKIMLSGDPPEAGWPDIHADFQLGMKNDLSPVQYVCVGYAMTYAPDGSAYNYMFAYNKNLSHHEVIPVKDVYAQMIGPAKESVVQDGTGNPPWYTHPDPAVNALILKVAEGATTKSVGWTNLQFKKVCKKASVPYSQQIPSAMAKDVATLFKPDVSSTLKDQIIGNLALKAKGKSATQVAKQQVKATAAMMPDSPVITSAKTIQPKTTKPTDDYASDMIKKIVEKSDPKFFFPTNKTVSGGSNPSKILTSAGGQAWFFKMAKDDNPARAYAEAAGYKFMQAVLHDDAVPVGVMTYDGKVGSVQPLLEGDAVSGGPGNLDDDDKARVLKQHMIDMFMGDHDGYACNWMRLKDGRLVAIDRGQAFKHVVKGTTESLDPYWDDPGNANSGQVWGKQLLREWIEGKTDIPTKAWKVARGMIDAIASVPKANLTELLKPLFDSLEMTETKRASILATLVKKQKAYLKDWTSTLKNYKAKFAWPSGVKTKLAVSVPDHDPKAMGFGATEEKEIQKAIDVGPAGRMLRIDRDAIEGQEVMVRRVLWAKGQKTVPATLVNFRIARHSGLALGQKMVQEFTSSGGKIAHTKDYDIEPGSQGYGPGLLQIDKINGYWVKIEAAIKTLNHHLAPASKKKSGAEPDLKVNQDTLAKCFAIVEPLKKLVQLTAKDMQGTYSQTNEPNDVVNAMASMYSDYIEYHIKPVADDLEGHLGTHTAELSSYTYTPKKPEEGSGERPEEPVVPTTKSYDLDVQDGGARVPKLKQTPQGLLVESLHGAPWSPGKQPHANIKGKNNAEVIILLPGPGIPGLQHGYEGYKGMAWGIAEGDPSTATVSYILRLFEDATGVKCNPATKMDREVHYWTKQAYVLQNGGKFHPKAQSSDPDAGVGMVDTKFIEAVNEYRNGNDSVALSALKKIVVSKTKKSVSELDKEAKGKIDGTFAKDGSGFQYVERIGWTRESLIDYLGEDFRIAHHITSQYSMLQFLEVLGDVPVLLAQNQRRFNGAGNEGGSPDTDLAVGGTQGIFACFRKGKTGQSDMLYFDQSLMLRTDVMVIPGGDSYGNIFKTRATTPEVWKNEADTHGPVGCSSSWQVNVRHAIDLPTYLWEAVCSGESDRDACIAYCKEKGWLSFAQGRTAAQVFTAKK